MRGEPQIKVHQRSGTAVNCDRSSTQRPITSGTRRSATRPLALPAFAFGCAFAVPEGPFEACAELSTVCALPSWMIANRLGKADGASLEYGEVAERLKALASKASVLERVPGVQIPPSPPGFRRADLRYARKLTENSRKPTHPLPAEAELGRGTLSGLGGPPAPAQRAPERLSMTPPATK
jgi:hypothetical protein